MACASKAVDKKEPFSELMDAFWEKEEAKEIGDLIERTFASPFADRACLRAHGEELLLKASKSTGNKTTVAASCLGRYCIRLASDAPNGLPLYFDAVFKKFIQEILADTPPRMHILGQVGKGGSGVVFRACFGTMKALVLKEGLRKDGEELKREVLMHHLIPPSNLLEGGGINLSYFKKDVKAPRLIYEAAKGDCYGALKSAGFSAEAIRSRIKQHAKALAHMHRFDLVHGDYKLKNALEMPDGRIVLADFSATRKKGDTPCGYTASYVSPEATNGDPVDPSMDVFSLGMVFYEMLSGEKMFAGENSLSIAVQIYSATQELFDEKIASFDAQDRDPKGDARHLLAALLRRDAKERPSMKYILSHPYFNPESGLSLETWQEGLPRRRARASSESTITGSSVDTTASSQPDSKSADDSFEALFGS